MDVNQPAYQTPYPNIVGQQYVTATDGNTTGYKTTTAVEGGSYIITNDMITIQDGTGESGWIQTTPPITEEQVDKFIESIKPSGSVPVEKKKTKKKKIKKSKSIFEGISFKI